MTRLPLGAWLAALLFLLFAALLFATPAWAQSGHHGHGHDAHHDWYKELRQPGTNASCCDDRDCRPTRAFVDDTGTWQALLDGAWIAVPRDRVLNRIAPDGRSHICADPGGRVLCFIGGVPKI